MMTRKIFLILIFLLAIFLRFYQLNTFPRGLNADEAAIGYNAYSLLKTGKDEFGHSWPINFQSFNDYKPGLYFYLVLPLVKIFGLNEWSVRLPSATLGALTVMVVYLLVKTLDKNSEKFALASALLLAISPWHLHFSRGGWETNVATFLICLGVYFFLTALKKPHYFFFSVVSLILSMFAYHSARVVVPLLSLILIFIFRKNIFVKQNFRSIFLAGTTGFVLLIVLGISMLGAAGASRFSGVGLFADQGPIWRVNELRGQHSNPFARWPKLFHNKYFEYGFLFFDNYLRHFNGNFLFISGDEIQRNRVPEMGQLYLVEAPFFVLGLYFLLKNKPRHWSLFLGWLAVAPVASALTFQSPHAIRSLNMVIPLTVITAYGATSFIEKIKNKKTIVRLSSCFIALVFVWNFSFYLHQYYVHYPKTYPLAWEDGFSQLANFLSVNQSRFTHVYITNKYDQPYILLAFFLKYPPKTFQQQAKLTAKDQYGFSTVDYFGNYSFGPINWEQLSPERQILIVGSPQEVPDSATIAKRIYSQDGQTEIFRIAER